MANVLQHGQSCNTARVPHAAAAHSQPVSRSALPHALQWNTPRDDALFAFAAAATWWMARVERQCAVRAVAVHVTVLAATQQMKRLVLGLERDGLEARSLVRSITKRLRLGQLPRASAEHCAASATAPRAYPTRTPLVRVAGHQIAHRVRPVHGNVRWHARSHVARRAHDGARHALHTCCVLDVMHHCA